jgi:type IV secretion system protein VirB5
MFARYRSLRPWVFSMALLGLGIEPAMAQIPVTDIAALTQLLTQFETMQNQLVTAQNQLTQAESTLQSMSGTRGMQNLLGRVNRNYLPTDWEELAAALNQTGGVYASLANDIRQLTIKNAVLTDAQLAALTPAQRELIESARQNAAGLEGLSRQALATTSKRFAALDGLIDAIGTASDQKSILDLQARIAAESGMLQNEASKLASIYRVTDAEERARLQRTRESALADVGSLRALPAMGL